MGNSGTIAADLDVRLAPCPAEGCGNSGKLRFTKIGWELVKLQLLRCCDSMRDGICQNFKHCQLFHKQL